MAMFGLKEVLDPLATQLAESARKIVDSLKNLEEALDLQNELTQTSNRLLATLVEQGRPARPRTTAKGAQQ